jgi:hypothetical protein
MTLRDHFYRKRAAIRARRRLLFTSPAEVDFVRLMGGKVVQIKWIRGGRNRYPLAIFLTLGVPLRWHNFKREVRVGRYWVDFASDVLWCIEIDGREYHTDIVAQAERDEYLRERGARVLHIQAAEIYRNPEKTKQRVLEYLAT